MNTWYPQNKNELNKLIDGYLSKSQIGEKKEIHGLIVPHAGYFYSGEVAGKAFSLLKDKKIKKDAVIILSPSHYLSINKITTHNQTSWATPLGDVKIIKDEKNFPKIDISEEHAIGNQIPFLQKLGFKKILPLVIGDISIEQAKKAAQQINDFNGIFIFSTDLSHFLTYDLAIRKDKKTINTIENLNSEELMSLENSACGIFPLLILIELCKIKKWKPKLIEYKNSGDVTHDKSSVVGYASFVF